MCHEILPLSFAEITASEAVLFDGGSPKSFVQIDCLAWLLKSQERTILVDTGIADFDVVNQTVRSSGRRWSANGRKSIVGQLADAGISPHDVSDIVLTHLHYDHASNVALFGNARVLVGEREWIWASSDEGRAALPQLAAVIEYLAALPSDRFVLLADTDEPLPGLKTKWVGGHTPGSLVVECNTSCGPVLLAGDAVFSLGNLSSNTPIGLTVSASQSADVLPYLSRFPGIVLPSHDAGALGQLTQTKVPA